MLPASMPLSIRPAITKGWPHPKAIPLAHKEGRESRLFLYSRMHWDSRLINGSFLLARGQVFYHFI